MDLGLDGKVALITGGSDGLGAALARRLAAEGARVAICARDRDRLESTAAGLRDAGAEVLAVAADVTVPGDIDRFVSAAVERWGRVDSVVNNAGRSAAGPFETMTDGALEADLQLKLFAAVRLIRAALPHLRASGGGAVVNVLNVAAKVPGPRSMPTSVSRAAGLSMTKVLSKEFGPHGIRVNAVLIGLVRSGQWVRQAEAAGVTLEEYYERIVAGADIPLGRVGDAEEFADFVTFLVSSRAAYLTGTAINFDGGMSAAV